MRWPGSASVDKPLAAEIAAACTFQVRDVMARPVRVRRASPENAPC